MAQQKKEITKPALSSHQKSNPSYILLVEDEPTHVAVLRHTLHAVNPNTVLKVACSLEEYHRTIEKSLPEIVLIDLHLPDGKALEILTSPSEAGLFPIVVMTSSGDEKIAVKAMKAGALDYVVKSSETFKSMPHTLERALREWKLIQERKQVEEELHVSEERFRSLYENVTIGLYRTTPSGKILLANQTLVKMLGYSSFEKLAERNLSKFGFEQAFQRNDFLKKIETEGELYDFESTWVRQDNSVLFVRESARAIRDAQGKTMYYDGAVEDITAYKLAEAAGRHAEAALQRVSRLYATLSQVNHTIVRVKDPEKLYQAICRIAVTVGQFRMAWIGSIDDQSDQVKHVTFDGHEDGYLQHITINISKDSPFGKGPSGLAIREGKLVISDNSQVDPKMSPWRKEALKRGYLSSAAVPFQFKGKVVGILNLYAAESGFFTEEEQRLLVEIGANISFALDSMASDTDRKRAEEALGASGERLHLALESANSGAWEWDLHTNENIWSDELWKLYGLEPHSCVPSYETWRQTIHPDDREFAERKVQEAARTESELNAEWRVVNRDGSVRWLLSRGRPLRNENGKPICFIGIVSDITERKKAEDELSMIKNVLEQSFEQSPVPMVLVNMPKAIIQITNPACIEFLGVKDEPSYVGTSLMNFNPTFMDYDAQGNLGKIKDLPLARALAGQTTSNEERRIVRKDGTMRWALVSGTPIRNVRGEIIAGYLTMYDITERKRSEEALISSESQFRELWGATVEGIVILDKGMIIEVNDAMCRMLGYTHEQSIGKSLLEFTPMEMRDKIRERIASGTEGRFETPVFRSDGVQILLEVFAKQIIFQNKSARMVAARDITERKRMEELLRESEERLRVTLETTKIGTWDWNLKNDIWYASPTFYTMLGYEPVQGPSDREEWLQRVHPDDRAATAEKIQNVLNGTNSAYQYEARMRHANGTYRWHHVLGHIIERDEDSKPTRLIGVRIDITERKRTEEALREIEARYRLISENTADVIWTLSFKTGKFTYVSDSVQKMRGYTPDEVMNQTMAEALTTESLQKVTQLLQEGIVNRKPGDSFQKKILSLVDQPCKDGSVVATEVVSTIVFNEQGEPVEIIGVSRDITERKKVEEALKRNEQKLHELFESAPVGYHEMDEQGNITAVNQTELKMFGYSYAQMIGSPAWEFVVDKEESKKRVLDKLAGNLTANKNAEQTFTRKDGTEFPALVDDVILRNEMGQITGIRTTILDITLRKKAEEDLRILSSAVEQSGSSIVITNLKGEIEYVNPKFIELTGYSDQEVIGKNPRILKSGYTSHEEYRNLWSVITQGGVWQGEFQNKKKNGNLYWESAIISPVRDSDGKITHFIGVKEDITHQRAVSERLRQMQKMEELGTLAGGIAHDFNNILGIILAYSTGIKRFKNDTKKLDLAADTIEKAVDRGKTLVQQILTFARKTEITFGAVNVNDVVMEIMTMVMGTFPKILTYAQNIDKSISFINADRSQLHQALLNLCVNARDAMPSGGVLSINTRMVSSLTMRTLHPDAIESNYVCIEIKDTGTGMDEEVKKRIFEPFFTTKEIGRGTGLGLAVVFGVVQSHKGFVDVDSEPGRGTRFQMYLPASPVAVPVTGEDEETLEDIPGGNEMLLVVEDEEMLMMSLRMLLVEKGYKVISAADGLTAVNIYKEREKDIALVLTDLGLPKMTGMEECAQIKGINPQARMIIATGFLDPEMKSEFLEAGVRHFLYKPYNFKKVLKMVREVLDEK